jgi:class 3 adenylate cyclase
MNRKTAAIPMCSLSARLCAEAKGGDILLSQRVVTARCEAFRTEPVGCGVAPGPA